jgi:hypothetical protein
MFSEREDGAIIVCDDGKFLGVIENGVFAPVGEAIDGQQMLIIALKMLKNDGIVKELYNAIEREDRWILELNFA